jgi:hypothetical protein
MTTSFLIGPYLPTRGRGHLFWKFWISRRSGFTSPNGMLIRKYSEAKLTGIDHVQNNRGGRDSYRTSWTETDSYIILPVLNCGILCYITRSARLMKTTKQRLEKELKLSLSRPRPRLEKVTVIITVSPVTLSWLKLEGALGSAEWGMGTVSLRVYSMFNAHQGSLNFILFFNRNGMKNADISKKICFKLKDHGEG